MTHLVIAGHGRKRNGGFDSGATGLISKGEHRYVSEDLFPAMKRHLPKGHNVVFFDEYNVYDYGNIVALANKFKADEVTEIHYDAGSSSASGGHVIIHDRYEPDKVDLALRDAIQSMVGVRYSHKGHKGISGRTNLANVNRTANAGITYRLIELGFGTNKKDAKIMTENVDEYAKALVKAIAGTVSDKPKPKPQSKPKTEPKPQSRWTKVTGNWSGQTLRNGQYGQPVRQLQSMLANNNPPFYPEKGAKNNGVDSYYGDKTENAVRRYQSYYGLTVDGLAGKQTYNSLKGSKPPSKSISEMADMIINQDDIKGHEARRKWLGIDKATYEKVRAEVNRRL